MHFAYFEYISKLISKIVKTTLSDTFTSDNYTEVLFDQVADVNEQRIVYNLSKEGSLFPKSFLFKLSSFADESEDIAEEESYDDVILSDGYDLKYSPTKNHSRGDTMDHDVYDQFFQQKNSNNDPDSYVFGFPLSFN